MKRKMKGILLFVLILSVLFCTLLGACKPQKEIETNQIPEENPEDYVYVPTFENLTMGECDWVKNVVIQEEALYYLKYNYDATGTSVYDICKRDLKENYEEQVLYSLADGTERENSENLNSFALLPEGKMALVISGNVGNQKAWNLKILDENGEELFAENITKEVCKETANADVLACVSDAEGNIYLQSLENVLVYDINGSFLFELKAKANGIEGMGKTEDGTILLLQQAGSGAELSTIHVNKKDYGTSYQGLPEDIVMSGNVITPGQNQDILLTTENGLVKYNFETKSYIEVLNWLDCNISVDKIRTVGVAEDGRVFAFINEQNGAEEVYQLCILTKTLKSQVPTVETITLGTFGLSPDMESEIAKFNKEHSDYQISVINYGENLNYEDRSTYMDAVTKFNMDIITGNAPDILDLDWMDYQYYMSKGVIEDLYPYLESSSNISREDLNDAVLNAYSVDGKLPCIPTCFWVSTIAARTSDVGNESGWTMADLIALADSKPKDTIMMYNVIKSEALRQCMRSELSEYIDWTLGECSFDSQEFKAVLELANRFEAEYNFDVPKHELIAEKKVLLTTADIIGFTDMQYYEALYQDDVTYIGYPTEDGTGGSYFGGKNLLGISSQSEHKEGAWLFLEQFLLDSPDFRLSLGFPILNSAYDKMLADAMEKEYERSSDGSLVLDEDGNPIETSKGGTGSQTTGFWVDYYAVTPEEAEQFAELIANTDRVMNQIEYSEIYNIIDEEAAAYFAGQKPVEEVMRNIQNRVQIYVSENQ